MDIVCAIQMTMKRPKNGRFLSTDSHAVSVNEMT